MENIFRLILKLIILKLIMDKLILVYYMEKRYLFEDAASVGRVKRIISNAIEEKGMDGAVFIVPIDDENEVRLECINPQHTSKETYDEILKNLEEIKGKL